MTNVLPDGSATSTSSPSMIRTEFLIAPIIHIEINHQDILGTVVTWILYLIGLSQMFLPLLHHTIQKPTNSAALVDSINNCSSPPLFATNSLALNCHLHCRMLNWLLPSRTLSFWH